MTDISDNFYLASHDASPRARYTDIFFYSTNKNKQFNFNLGSYLVREVMKIISGLERHTSNPVFRVDEKRFIQSAL